VNTQDFLKILGITVLYLLVQIFLVKNLVFFDVAFCFIYVSIIFFLPNSLSTSLILIFSFIIGLIVDAFYNTAGMHASACLLIAFLRPYIIKVLFPTKGLESEITISKVGMGTERFIRYIVIMTFIHHFYLFFLESNSMHFFLNTTLKIIASVLFTTLMVFALHIYFKSLQNS
jgi:hypothetical protein